MSVSVPYGLQNHILNVFCFHIFLLSGIIWEILSSYARVTGEKKKYIRMFLHDRKKYIICKFLHDENQESMLVPTRM